MALKINYAADKPDSDYKYRIVSGYDGHRLTWHALDCKTGRNAKYSKRTAYTPDERRERIKAQHDGRDPYYRDHMAGCCLAKQSDQVTTATSPSFTTRQAGKLLRDARTAGLLAGNGATPAPMIVGSPTTPLGDHIDYGKKTYYVAEGACGFAWVVIRPGNSSIARQAKKLGIGRPNYGGGVAIWIHDHGQSIDRKTLHARAYAKVLQDHGINAAPESRLD
jgi:hypothetical protein